jgi:hypothetical protein
VPTYGMTEAQVRGYFTTQNILSREAENLPPLSTEQIRDLWDALTPAERVEHHPYPRRRGRDLRESHEFELKTMNRLFADVITTDELLKMLVP